MENNMGYIYLRSHPAYDEYNACKMGKATNIPERDSQYATGEIERGFFEKVFEVPKEKMGCVERFLQYEFRDFNIRYDGGIEFYDKQIIPLIKPCLMKMAIKWRELTKQEMDDLVRYNRVRKTMKKIDIRELIRVLKSNRRMVKPYVWNGREYQTEIIQFGKGELFSKQKIYLELPTGGGKSYIVYNLLEYLKSNFILIVSPRKVVNSQNISAKYLQLLTDEYKTFNYSCDDNFDDYLKLPGKKIVICCTQSIQKLYETIVSNAIVDIGVWFDEAHWSVEEWVDKVEHDEKSRFWLLDDGFIKNRIFTSASPNKEKILQNEDIFGRLYSPIKVRELIDLKWLSPIQPYVYSENIENVDNVKYLIRDFNEKHRKFGFSFHNKQQNAFNLFYKHYLQYSSGETLTKPFLLVSDNFTVEREPKLGEIELNYEYKNIKVFETTPGSIGYVVAKYSMGYDFSQLDFICLSDPKLSIQDIKQCIGRGIRPDELGLNGSNLEKVLVISLPVYVDEKGINKYEKIMEVLKYLLYDVEISIEDIVFTNRYNGNSKTVQNSSDYFGINDVKSVLLDLLVWENKKNAMETTFEKARKIIAEKGIKSKESYYEFCEKDNRLSKDPETVFKGQFTNWIEYLSIERVYYDLETCKSKVGEYLSLNPEIKKHYLDLYVVCAELCKMDALFPPPELWVDYYHLKDLKDVITIVNMKKRNRALI